MLSRDAASGFRSRLRRLRSSGPLMLRFAGLPSGLNVVAMIEPRRGSGMQRTRTAPRSTDREKDPPRRDDNRSIRPRHWRGGGAEPVSLAQIVAEALDAFAGRLQVLHRRRVGDAEVRPKP